MFSIDVFHNNIGNNSLINSFAKFLSSKNFLLCVSHESVILIYCLLSVILFSTVRTTLNIVKNTLCFLNQEMRQIPWKMCLQYPILIKSVIEIGSRQITQSISLTYFYFLWIWRLVLSWPSPSRLKGDWSLL